MSKFDLSYDWVQVLDDEPIPAKNKTKCQVNHGFRPMWSILTPQQFIYANHCRIYLQVLATILWRGILGRRSKVLLLILILDLLDNAF